MKHGHCSGGKISATYTTWRSMILRCKNKKTNDYKRYGGAGIKVCYQWLVFENFLRDMGEKPLGKTLDRIDSSGDYEPKNCRWSTPREQNLNRKNTVYVTFRGNRHCLAYLLGFFGLRHDTFQNRIKRGWSVEEALEIPVTGCNYRKPK